MSRRLREFASVLSLSACLGLVACSTSTPLADIPMADMDFALDTGGQAMLFAGTARIPRSFNSPTPFEIDLGGVKPWGSNPTNEASAFAAEAFPEKLPTGTYYPLGDSGKVVLGRGRMELRGTVEEDGKKLSGDWSFNGQPGGSFVIAQDGHIFP